MHIQKLVTFGVLCVTGSFHRGTNAFCVTHLLKPVFLSGMEGRMAKVCFGFCCYMSRHDGKQSVNSSSGLLIKNVLLSSATLVLYCGLKH